MEQGGLLGAAGKIALLRGIATAGEYALAGPGGKIALKPRA